MYPAWSEPSLFVIPFFFAEPLAPPIHDARMDDHTDNANEYAGQEDPFCRPNAEGIRFNGTHTGLFLKCFG